MASIPDVDKNRTDVIDLITDSAKQYVNIEGVDGKLEQVSQLDYNKIWWKTQIINSNNFGRFAFILERFEALASECVNNMSYERAAVISKQIKDISSAARYSIDAKSSETMHDKNNSRSNLIHLVSKNKVEKNYRILGDKNRTFKDAILGSNSKEDEEGY